jgi:hypothetical protein
MITVTEPVNNINQMVLLTQDEIPLLNQLSFSFNFSLVASCYWWLAISRSLNSWWLRLMSLLIPDWLRQRFMIVFISCHCENVFDWILENVIPHLTWHHALMVILHFSIMCVLMCFGILYTTFRHLSRINGLSQPQYRSVYVQVWWSVRGRCVMMDYIIMSMCDDVCFFCV